jgi:hypothetical protein
MSEADLTLRLIKPDAAEPRMRQIYEETRRTLHLPWVGALFHGYAMYPGYLEMAWRTLRPSLETAQFEADARAVGNAADEAVARFYTPSYDYRTVAAMNVDIEAIRETVDAFHIGNPRLLLVATALRRTFEEGTVGGGTPVVLGRAHESVEEIHAERTTVEMIDPEQASPRVQQIFNDIKTTLGLPLVNSDYQAMGLWPDYLALAWNDAKGVVGTPEYAAELRRPGGLASDAVDRFAAPVTATREAAMQAGVSTDQLDNLAAILRLFAGLLPGLILNVAMFYHAVT